MPWWVWVLLAVWTVVSLAAGVALGKAVRNRERFGHRERRR
jgi:uncharacterized membrane protein